MLRKIFMISSLAFSTANLHADATDDLFAAIEKSDVKGVKAALEYGADVAQVRTDKHTPYTLAIAKQNEYLATVRSYKGILPVVSIICLPIASILHNPTIGIASTIAAWVPIIVDEKKPPSNISMILNCAGLISLLITAWKSEYKAIAGIGTIGALIATYQHSHYYKRMQIVKHTAAAQFNDLFIK